MPSSHDPPIGNTNPSSKWDITRIRRLVEKKFQKHTCWFQVQIALALFDGKDMVGIAPTGAGKTLSFWIPLLMALEEDESKMSFIVTPLNLLGEQNQQELERAGLHAIAVNGENSNETTFKMCNLLKVDYGRV